MVYKITCTYCGHHWEAYIYTQAQLAGKICTKCDDKHLRFQELNDTKIDTYIGCPPFPEKKKDDFYGD